MSDAIPANDISTSQEGLTTDEDVAGSDPTGVPLTSGGRSRHRLSAAGWPIQAGRVSLLFLVLFIVEHAVNQGWLDERFVARPTDVVDFLRESWSSGQLWVDAKDTLVATSVAFVLGSLTGMASGMLLARFSVLEALVAPFVTVLNSMPRVALAPLFILWFGLGIQSKMLVGASLVYFIMLLNTRAGLRSADQELIVLSRMLGHSELRRFRKVLLPEAVPAIFAGFRLSAVYALLGVVTGEMVASRHGLGQLISLYTNTFNIPGVFGILLVLALISVVITMAMGLIERRLLRWQALD